MKWGNRISVSSTAHPSPSLFPFSVLTHFPLLFRVHGEERCFTDNLVPIFSSAHSAYTYGKAQKDGDLVFTTLL